MGLWLGSCEITKNPINLELIKVIQLCWKIYDLGGCMVGLRSGSCQITKN